MHDLGITHCDEQSTFSIPRSFVLHKANSDWILPVEQIVLAPKIRKVFTHDVGNACFCDLARSVHISLNMSRACSSWDSRLLLRSASGWPDLSPACPSLERRRKALVKALSPQKGRDRHERHRHYGFRMTFLSFLLLIFFKKSTSYPKFSY